MAPLVSVIMPAYNAARFVGGAVQSVLSQTYPDVEFVIVDDGSTDSTAQIVHSYADPRIVYLWQPNAGQGPARNAGIRRSRGEFMTFLDADDYYLPTKVESQLKFLLANSEYKVVYCNAWHFYEGCPNVLYRSRRRGRSGNILPELLQTSYINPNTVMMARDVLDVAGLFNETRYYPEEWEMWLKIALAGYEFGYMDEDLVVVECRPDSNTTMEIQPILKRNAVEMFERLFVKGIEVKGTVYDATRTIKSLKIKMALAHLMNGHRREFVSSFAAASDLKVLAAGAGVALAMVPGRLIRWLWRLNRYRQAERLPSVDYGEGMRRPHGHLVGAARGRKYARAAAEGEMRVFQLPFSSIVVAVRNEEENIARCLGQLVGQDYPKDRLEIIVADGMSTDRTAEIVESFPTNGILVRLVRNPGLGRAQGLNAAIRAARGEIIARVDARTVIEPDYLSCCVSTLLETGADNVGGVQRPVARTPTQEAIGLALSHPFGVGNAQFRLGKKSGYVDTVYLGCFRREVFEKVGFFDEDASVISEDSDMNQRIREAGGKIYLNKDIVAYYFPRETFREFWKLYFRYGGARAGNFLKHRRLTSWRQAGWPLFILGLALVLSLSVVDRAFLLLLAGGTGFYLLVDGVVSVSLATQVKKLALLPRLMGAFACIHFAYGLGFWKRLLVPDRAGTYWGN